MKAVRFHEVGGPEVLQYGEIEQPNPGAGQVRLRVAASAFSAADNGMRAGFLPIPLTLPHIPGYDVAGTVDAVGEGVTGFAIGDPVIGFLPMGEDGGAAEYAIAPADALVPAPTSVPLADAAACRAGRHAPQPGPDRAGRVHRPGCAGPRRRHRREHDRLDAGTPEAAAGPIAGKVVVVP